MSARLSVRTTFRALLALAFVLALLNAISHSWVNDDAFISFRYAKNFVEGRGLVYNAGERVEGYTNFLWTMMIACGMAVGLDPATLATVVGIICSLATVILFAALSTTLFAEKEPTILIFPFTSLALSLHRDFGVYATSGLETSLFTLLVSGIFAALILLPSRRGLVVSGMLSSVAMFTRPDGAVFFLLSIVFILLSRRDGLKKALLFALPALLTYVPYWFIRYGYYGDFFPNSFYAKSIDQPYYSQGLWYLWLFFSSYYVFLALIPLALWALLKGTRTDEERSFMSFLREMNSRSSALFLGLLFCFGFVLFVLRIGGDFMFARFLIPVTPLLFFSLELLVKKLLRRPPALVAAMVLICAATLLRIDHFEGKGDFIHGIADEWVYYPKEHLVRARKEGEILRSYFRRAPVTVACMGGQAQLMYYADPAVIIESTTGLTDRYIAHLPLPARGRVGHEKAAPMDYLRTRKVNFMFVPDSGFTNDIVIHGIRGTIIVYDDSLMSRFDGDTNVSFLRFPQFLDAFIANDLPGLSPREVRDAYEHFKEYYFAWNRDSTRERAFVDALRR